MLLHAKPELAAGGTNTTQMEVIQDFCVQIKFVPEFEEHLDNAQLSKTDIFLHPMTMNCSYLVKRLIQSQPSGESYL